MDNKDFEELNDEITEDELEEELDEEDYDDEEDMDDIEVMQETAGFVEDLFKNFLTAEDIFRMEYEKYYPEFMKRLRNNTLDTDEEFKYYSAQVAQLARDADIDIAEFTMNYVKEKETEKFAEDE